MYKTAPASMAMVDVAQIGALRQVNEGDRRRRNCSVLRLIRSLRVRGVGTTSLAL
jgi:hypothetical protein